MTRSPSVYQTDPFQLGYLAAARFTKRLGDAGTTTIAPCPYRLVDSAAAVWMDGWNEWQHDLAAGMTPPSWRI